MRRCLNSNSTIHRLSRRLWFIKLIIDEALQNKRECAPPVCDCGCQKTRLNYPLAVSAEIKFEFMCAVRVDCIYLIVCSYEKLAQSRIC